MRGLIKIKTTYKNIVTVAALYLLLLGTANANDKITDGLLSTEQNQAKNKKPSRHVRCDRGGKLAHFIKRAKPGDRLFISGVCQESVLINIDNLQLIGIAEAGLDGSTTDSEGVIIIDGARGIVLENLRIENGSDQGIVATHNAQGLFNKLQVKNHHTVGITLDRSHFDLTDVQVSGNGSSGMDIFAASSAVVRGDIDASNNAGDGIAVNGKSYFELRGAKINANNNQGSGVSIINDSRLQIFSFPEAQGSSITANVNGFAGLGLLGAELGVVGSQFFGSGANVITVSDNVIGFFMPAGAILSPHATAKFIAHNNGLGMLLEDGASALIVGGLDISLNGVGIDATGAGTLNIVSVPPNPSSVLDNQLDLNLGFGTRATFSDVTTVAVVCDETVLIRGSVACP